MFFYFNLWKKNHKSFIIVLRQGVGQLNKKLSAFISLIKSKL